jgi:DNA-binding transcriptional LysR family regulator
MDVTNKSRVVKSLEQNEVDFALVSVIPDHLKLDRVELMKNKLFLVGNTKRELPKKMPKKKIFQELPLIFREEGSATRNAMESYMKKHKYSTRKKIELTSNEALKQAVTAGLGYSIMPLIGIKNSLKNKELQIIPVRDLPIVTHWNLVWLKSKSLSPTAQAFLDYIRNEKERIIKETFDWFEQY